MPIKASAKKALRQDQKRALHNAIIKRAYKDAMKATTKAIEAGKGVQEAARLAQKKLAKAAKLGVLKKNTAARKLSRLMKKVNAAAK